MNMEPGIIGEELDIPNQLPIWMGRIRIKGMPKSRKSQ
jgi:hypothetical protein